GSPTQGGTESELLPVGAEVGSDALPQRLPGLEARAATGRLDAHALRRVVVHGDADGGQALVGPAGGRGGAPHRIGAVRDDGAGVRLRAVRRPHSGRRQQSGRPPQAQHPALAGANPGQAHACPHFAVALPDERRPRQHAPHLLDQRGIGPGRLGAALLQRCRPLRSRPHGIQGGTGHAQRLTGAPTPIPSTGGGRAPLAHGLDRRAATGRSASARSARSRSSSFALVSSPLLARRRATVSSRASVGRLRPAAWPPARNWSRHWASVAAVTPSSRLSVSSAPPRNTRNTASVFRREDHRPRSAAASGGERDSFIDTSSSGHHAPKRVSMKTLGQRNWGAIVAGPCELLLPGTLP